MNTLPILVCALGLVFAPVLAPGADLTTIRNDPNPAHRAELAIENANTAVDAAKNALSAEDAAKFNASIEEVAQSAELAYDSLAGEAHRNTKAFKKAEQATRMLLRRLDSLHQLADFENRAKIEKVRDRVAAVNDNLLNGIMKKK